LVVWGILKIRDHVLSPMQTPVMEGVVRLLAGGGCFALPTVVMVAYNSVALLIAPHTATGWNTGGVSAGGLDAMMVNFVDDIYAPTALIMNFFGYVVGMIFVLIGITRLLKSTQEGPRGPGGIGTMATFIVGGTLIAFSPMITAMSNSLFGSGNTNSMSFLAFTAGMNPVEIGHVNAVISAATKFMMMVGMISIMRGFFIIRDVAEGNGQASMMSGITHLVGGGLAVNLGPLITSAQATLGIVGLGITYV
jgi:hypothetical protein